MGDGIDFYEDDCPPLSATAGELFAQKYLAAGGPSRIPHLIFAPVRQRAGVASFSDKASFSRLASRQKHAPLSSSLNVCFGGQKLLIWVVDRQISEISQYSPSSS